MDIKRIPDPLAPLRMFIEIPRKLFLKVAKDLQEERMNRESAERKATREDRRHF